MDDDALDAALEPGARGRSRHRLRHLRGGRVWGGWLPGGNGTRYLIGEARAAAYERELANATKVGTIRGRELEGRRYRPLFPYFADQPNAFRVLVADFVTTEDGTGVVHLAPGFGEDDQRACEAAGIAVVCPVDEQTRFTSEVPDLEGLQVFEANGPVIADLKARGLLVRHESYVHSYPHCWRTDTPLVYRAVSSWFVEVTAIKDRMLELNQQIHWVPEHVRDGSFGKWLEGARDWSISRNRFWGSPLPIWKSDDPAYPRIDVYGSLDDLERDFGVRPEDLHRPAIDELTRPNPDDPTGRSTMRRVGDVLDCWFESGSMPFAQVHYPFENVDWFESHFPGDFIVEYIGQTRGWFYTLHVLATALFDRPAFKNCVVHGVLLGDDNQKLSKRLGNYPDPIDVFDTVGADAMRWALLSSPVLRGGDMITDRRGMEESVRQVIMPIWNAWYFFALYANAAGTVGRELTSLPDNVLDRYILAKVRELGDDLTTRMDAYDLSGACGSIVAFIDSLNNWYIRRSRDRFWAGDQDAIDTLHTTLSLLCRLAAPLLPITLEAVYRGLTGRPSVHLEDWPLDPLATDAALVAAMDGVRAACSVASSIRKAESVPNRQPLASLTIAGPAGDALAPFAAVIADEANVKDVVFHPEASVERVLQLRPAVLGPRVGADVQKLLRAAKDGDYEIDGDRVVVLGRALETDEYDLALRSGDAGTRVVPGTDTVVTLDLAVTPELAAEGLVRYLVRQVNDLRKRSGLQVTDRIHLHVDAGRHADVVAAIEEHEKMLLDETLATELAFQPMNDAHRIALPDGRVIHVKVPVVAA